MSDTELADDVHELSRELVAIIMLTTRTIAALDTADPRREDMIDIRTAARLAMGKLHQLGHTAPALTLVAS